MAEENLEQISKQAQDYYKETPVIILGSGASAAFNMSGMWDLSQHLIKNISPTDLSPQEQDLWNQFSDLLESKVDLENALHQVSLSSVLTERVLMSTWNLLVPQDLAVFEQSLKEPDLFALGKLLKHMFRSTRNELNIISPNYDRLAEYACEQENLHHYSGFSHGYRKHHIGKDYLKCARQVNIWKVHGSLDWFVNKKGIISALGNVEKIPGGLKPLIVTPGIEKYRNTHREPYKTVIHESDDVIDAATSYLCVGFGFNDEHIQEKLVNRCAKEDAKVMVVTHKLSDSAKNFLFEGDIKNYLAIEVGDNDNKSIIYSSLHADPIYLNGNYWSLDGFLNLIM
ncbi:MAG: SIR2 family protein [Methylomarinum sp.]|nr:SIR2 family protein [Methylomarinum sp.]